MVMTKVTVKTFRDLLVWQKAHLLALKVYECSKVFPSEEKYGLISQLRRSVSSIPTNIVEGQKRNSTKDFLHFLNTADASLEETKYLILLSKDLGYLGYQEYDDLNAMCDEVGKMLNGLQKKLIS